MAATAAAMGAAAAAMRQQQQDIEDEKNSKNRARNHSRPETKEEREERRDMKDFEEEFMRMLTRTSLRRFAQSDGVPAADSQESILEACSKQGAHAKKLLTPAELLEELAREDAEEDARMMANANEEDDENNDDDIESNRPKQKQQQQQQQPHSPQPKKNNFNPRDLTLELDSKYLSAEEKKMLRREHDLRWLHAIPSRLRNWLEANSRINPDKTSTTPTESAKFLPTQLELDIFTELVVRVPIIGAGKDEVVAFCSPFGHCEYQGPCFSSSASTSSSSKNKNENNKESSKQQNNEDEEESLSAKDVHRKFCHIVKFSSGVDAVRCFIELNGYYLDPKQCQDELSAAAVLAMKSAKRGKDKPQQGYHHDSLDEKMKDPEFLASALGDLDLKSGEVFGPPEEDDLAQCWTSRFIFITCDFFRISFYNKAKLCDEKISAEFIPRVEMKTRSPYEDISFASSSKKTTSMMNKGFSAFFSSFMGQDGDDDLSSSTSSKKASSASSSSSSVASKIPSNWNPADILCKKLAARARELIGIFPLVASHKDIEWQGMCRASNTISMFIPIPEKRRNNSDDNNNDENDQKVWIQTLRALRGCNVNIVALFRAIDNSTSIEELLDLSFKFSFEESRVGKNAKKGIIDLPSEGENNNSKNKEHYTGDKSSNNTNNLNEKKSKFWDQFAFGKFNSPDPAGLLSQEKSSVIHGQRVLEERQRNRRNDHQEQQEQQQGK